MTTAPKYWPLTLIVILLDKCYMSLAAVEDLTNAQSIKEALVVGLRNAV